MLVAPWGGSGLLLSGSAGLGLVAVEQGFDHVGDGVAVALVERGGLCDQATEIVAWGQLSFLGVEGQLVDADGKDHGQVAQDLQRRLVAAGFELYQI